MKKNYWLLGLLFICCSCTDVGDFSKELVSQNSELTTRTAGDENYDVLGYGYDVTGEYLHPLSVRNPVLNVAKYDQENHERVRYGTSSFGYDRMYYGYSSADYVKDITTSTKATYTMNYGSEKDTIFFSNTISDNAYLKTSYSYSDKYSFASLDAIRNLKYIYINDEISCLSQYLSDSFKEDLERLSPDRVVERYGTHVLTDFIIGGRYRLIFRSVINKMENSATKRRTVSSGFKSSLDGIGFSYNLENSDTIDEKLVKENHHKELYVLFYGGSGTNMKYDLEKGTPTSIDMQSWEKSVSLGNSCLTDINWKETYPIYYFVSDPVKKEQIRNAVERHISASQLNMLELLPLYSYYHEVICDHCVTTNPNIAENYDGWEFLRVEGYILKKQLQGTLILREYYNDIAGDHYLTTLSDIHQKYPTYEEKTPLGYIYCDVNINGIPLYEYYHEENANHYTSTRNDIIGNYSGWTRLNHSISGYIYPAD